jgi:hypothetical protein
MTHNAEVTVIARQGKRLTDSEIVEAVQSSEGHARVSSDFTMSVPSRKRKLLMVVINVLPAQECSRCVRDP